MNNVLFMLCLVIFTQIALVAIGYKIKEKMLEK